MRKNLSKELYNSEVINTVILNLVKLGIISGQDPLRFWIIDKPLCELDTLNPQIIIKNKNIKQNQDFTRNFSLQRGIIQKED